MLLASGADAARADTEIEAVLAGAKPAVGREADSGGVSAQARASLDGKFRQLTDSRERANARNRKAE